jgi:hypothetical protein
MYSRVVKRLAAALLLAYVATPAVADCSGNAFPPTITISNVLLGVGENIELDVKALEGTLIALNGRIRIAESRTFLLRLTHARVVLRDTTVKILLSEALRPSDLRDLNYGTRDGFIKESAKWHGFPIDLRGSLLPDHGLIRLGDKPSWFVRWKAASVLEKSRDKAIVMNGDGYVIIDPVKLLAPHLSYTGALTAVQAGTGSLTETFGPPFAESAASFVAIKGDGAAALLDLTDVVNEVVLSTASRRVEIKLADLTETIKHSKRTRSGCVLNIELP